MFIIAPNGSAFIWTKSISSEYLAAGAKNNLCKAVPPRKAKRSRINSSLNNAIRLRCMIKSCST